MQIQEEQKREEAEAEVAAANQMEPNQNAAIDNDQAANFNVAEPNVIGNVEDMPSVQLA